MGVTSSPRLYKLYIPFRPLTLALIMQIINKYFHGTLQTLFHIHRICAVAYLNWWEALISRLRTNKTIKTVGKIAS